MMASLKITRHIVRQYGILLLPVLLLFTSASMAAVSEQTGGSAVQNPGTDLWRAVREGPTPNVGTSQVQSVGSTTLIAESGEKWRTLRRQYMIPWGGWLLAGMLGLIVVFHLVRKAPERFDESSEQWIQRFPGYDRILHWFMAGTFIFLALTGLVLLLGRFLLLPVLGPEAFGAIASACKEGHNLFGPLFMLALVLFLLRFASRNWFTRGDLSWFARGGGMFSGKHPSAGFFNAGEKLLFWSLAFAGAVLCVSGLILLFPQFGQSRELMQTLMLLHALAALGIVAFTFGHIYLATIGVPGSLNAMNTGRVDADWARAHHDRWHRECEEQGLIEKQQS